MLVVNERIQIPDTEFELSFARSSGPGGQNVNKVSSKAVLKWNAVATTSLPYDVKERFLARYKSKITLEGYFMTTSEKTRDRNKNISDCFEKLKEAILAIATPPKKRKATEPTWGSQRRRLETKRKDSDKKRMRSKVTKYD